MGDQAQQRPGWQFWIDRADGRVEAVASCTGGFFPGS
jgi:hypothetical protein